MRFLITIVFILAFLHSTAIAQSNRDLVQRIEQLEQRVAALEAENRQLRGQNSATKFLDDANDGQRVEIKNGDRLLATLVVGQRGWGDSRPQDVAAVAESVAKTIFTVMAPQDTPTIILQRSEHGPRALSDRGPNNEYVVLVNTGDRLWAQLAYQLAHELGHVLCRELDEHAPQHWFEEAFCEAMSIWTLEQMATSWQTDPPYDVWKSYAVSLGNYAADVRKQVDRPADFGKWYTEHRNLLDRDPYDRDKNRIVAEHIANRASAKPEYLIAFLHLRTTPPSVNSMESILGAWISSCPAELKFVARDVADLLGVVIAAESP